MTMLRIDGSAGGGQLLRWAIAMAAVRDVPVTVENVRGARDTPGLRPQHVAAVEAVAELTNASVAGVSAGSETVEFQPGPLDGETVSVDVGTAGSIALVFDTVLPLSMTTGKALELTVTGGTDVKWSPPIDYHRFVKLPVLESMGVHAAISVDRRGFYPAGGGKATLKIRPGSPERFELTERGELQGVQIHSIATDDLQDPEVADRQASAASEMISAEFDTAIETNVAYVSAHSTGSSLLVVANYETTRAGFSALGEPGKPAETVAKEAVDSFRDFESSRAAVEPHLADQLLPFLAEPGGTITTPRSTDHIETATKLLGEFGYRFDVRETRVGVQISSPGVNGTAQTQ